MEINDFRKEIEGFEEIQKEVAVLRKYAFDYSSQKGRTTQIMNLLHPKTLHLRVAEIREEKNFHENFPPGIRGILSAALPGRPDKSGG